MALTLPQKPSTTTDAGRSASRIAKGAPALDADSFLERVAQADQYCNAVLAEALPDGLTPTQYRIMNALGRHSPCTQTRLVEVTGIDRSTLADVIRRLVGRGLIKRKRTKEDTRAYAVKLTSDGMAALREARRVADKLDKTLKGEIISSLRSG